MDHLSHSLTLPPEPSPSTNHFHHFFLHFKFPYQKSIMFNPRSELATHPPHSFEKWGDLSFVPNNQKMVQNYRNDWNSHGGGVQFRLETMEEADSGVCSPPLWGNSTPPRPQNPVQPRQNSSRKQAIAKGQSELMEMVKNMPESCYELSLKDIVEHKYQTGFGLGLGAADQEDFSVNSNEEKAIFGANNKRFNEKNKVLRSRSKDDQNRGMLLKMGFVPFFSFNGSKKKKKGCVRNNNTCSKVSPKPESSPRNVEKDWWRKRLAVSGESESGEDSSHGGSTTGSSDSSRSNSSSNSGRRNTGDRKSGCWPIFRSKKNKDAR